MRRFAPLQPELRTTCERSPPRMTAPGPLVRTRANAWIVSPARSIGDEATEEKMQRAKRTKRADAKATLDHVTGSTGRDGAFDFASRTELLSKLSDGPPRGGAKPNVDA